MWSIAALDFHFNFKVPTALLVFQVHRSVVSLLSLSETHVRVEAARLPSRLLHTSS